MCESLASRTTKENFSAEYLFLPRQWTPMKPWKPILTLACLCLLFVFAPGGRSITTLTAKMHVTNPRDSSIIKEGRLLLVQAVFRQEDTASLFIVSKPASCCVCCAILVPLPSCPCRHGARTPLNTLFFPNNTYSDCHNEYPGDEI